MRGKFSSLIQSILQLLILFKLIDSLKLRIYCNLYTSDYGRSIFGWNVVEDVNKEGLEVPMSFGFNCSQGALKTLAVSSGGLYLSCGGTDERIRIFNVAENRSMGELGLHEGAITSLEFFEDSHMISGSEVRNLLTDFMCISNGYFNLLIFLEVGCEFYYQVKYVISIT
jgi:WD40 repeat protein